jgi:hypothetical protein
MKKYVDFKIANPYSEKDLEYETEPTPKASKLIQIKENYFKGITKKNEIKAVKEEGRIIKPNIEIKMRGDQMLLKLNKKSINYA